MSDSRPIGVFDSGVGGLSIAREIRRLSPSEDLLYFADVDFSPYGTKPVELIQKRSERIVDFLLERDCKALVVACNTATVNSICDLRSKFSVPIIGVEPGIKPAALQSATGVIGVLATEQTLKSESFRQLHATYADRIKIETKACPEFVTLVEALEHNSEQAIHVAEKYLRPLLLAGCDQIVLGCTHFSFLRSSIESLLAGEVGVIDTATPVAMELSRRLYEMGQANKQTLAGCMEFWTSGDSTKVKTVTSALWGEEVSVTCVVF